MHAGLTMGTSLALASFGATGAGCKGPLSYNSAWQRCSRCIGNGYEVRCYCTCCLPVGRFGGTAARSTAMHMPKMCPQK